MADGEKTIRLLEEKFPGQVGEEDEARVRNANEEELDTWTKKVIHAVTISEVFAAPTSWTRISWFPSSPAL